jgi:4-hydroxy-tetrahydrodipicolinate reductase
MGASLLRAAQARPDIVLVGAADRPGSDAIGHDWGRVAGLAEVGLAITADPIAAAADADVWIDFSTPDATRAAIEAIAQVSSVRAAIIGTTGLDAASDDAIETASGRLAIVKSGNFSRGVNLLASLVRQLAGRLGADWDIEICETHHRRKVDAPSGTALLLGEAAAQGRGRKLRELRLPAREGVTGSRPEGGIGFAALRAGGVVGDHDVIFASENEVLRLSHHAQDRTLFADGALDAAFWAMDRPPGLYSMQDVLAL